MISFKSVKFKSDVTLALTMRSVYVGKDVGYDDNEVLVDHIWGHEYGVRVFLDNGKTVLVPWSNVNSAVEESDD